MVHIEFIFLFQSEIWGYKPWLNHKATDSENERAKKAFEAVLTVTASSSYTAEYENFSATVKRLSKRMFNYDYPEQVSMFVANFHDAVLLYATALREVVQEQGMEAKSDGKLIVTKMWKRTISGVSGEVNIDGNGDRKADYALLDMDPVTGEFMVAVGVYRGLNSTFELNDSRPIHWPNRQGLGPPLDEPNCGFDGSRCETGMFRWCISSLFSSFSRKSGEYKPWLNHKATDSENERAKKAFEAVLTVTASSSYTAEYENFSATVKRLSKRMFNYDYPEQVSSFVANFHDAVLLYATALREVVQEQGMEAKSDGKLIVTKMWNRTISGVSGEVNIDGNGDRKADYALLDMDPVTGEFMTVGVYRGLNSTFELNDSRPIHWPNRQGLGPPLDEPNCGFDGSRCETGMCKCLSSLRLINEFDLLSPGIHK
ncbi:hypothetical protein TCAL_15075 [Tigriopus californicus]|uniref:Receptor ligand binding region domain-containing protein n=1 Tax=Tigriopus californicus TaxID=6832 RepID=A0A553NTV9_TIGCA|nr:hypothetical protein TCAL_15075 [Tigriopus californicus]